ncbi:decapping and exoribonuclease protein-like isoform X2 [Mercenaria mercenaria]|uniref:decapping and exoribonuclease protein-like isoform X2 n=1 Tax=Mercenaria mercenaria TaxID=6596 RepID=UPI00234EC09A|nr:decapping and exoribonuclease protein-like isoform X2 [Mercenaria mercenaria]XP_053390800.1 decapping and exoribonuclease protein-like isoform X2 [Mercenaria mercenaria]
MCAASYRDDHRGVKEAVIGTKIASFETRNRRAFDMEHPSFKPEETGSFSLDIDRKYENTTKQLKYYVKPPENSVHFDLRKGYSTMIRKDESTPNYITDILGWITDNKEKLVEEDMKTTRQLNTDFVCWRGLYTKFLCTPYENREGWLVAVTLYNGTYYLCEFETEQKKQQNASRTKRDDEMCCWGWKFEQYLTADSPTGVPDTESPYNNCEAFCTVVRSRLNSHSLVYSGEVDAVYTDDVYGKHYIELKTSRDFSHPRQYVNFKRFKLIKWWAQSFLVGIPEIVCGYRDDDGIVHRLESFSTKKLPEIAKDISNPWKANVCFNFLDQLLSFIKSTVKIDDHRTVHLLQWSPGEPVWCSKPLNDSEYNFLPDWYTK